jgi:RNA polymerase sigma factor FliA
VLSENPLLRGAVLFRRQEVRKREWFWLDLLTRWTASARRSSFQIYKARLQMASQVLMPHRKTCFHDRSIRLRRVNHPPKSECAKAITPLVVSNQQRGSNAMPPDRERERRVLELLPLVRRIALKMRRNLPAHVELDDLVSAGTLGLLDAAKKFDIRRHVKMESYARYRIRGAILDGLRTLDTVSRDLRKRNKKVEKVHHDLQSKLGRPVEVEEIAGALGVKLQGAGVDWLSPMRLITFRQVGEENLPAVDQESQFDLCYRRERRDIANRALACLPARERDIVILYHIREMTMKQIGAKLQIDESRVSQLHSAAVARLRLGVKAILERSQPITGLPSTPMNLAFS